MWSTDPMPDTPDDATLRALLARPLRIAVVGLSSKPERPLWRVVRQMQR
jgi:predicted CoA-binding protein